MARLDQTRPKRYNFIPIILTDIRLYISFKPNYNMRKILLAMSMFLSLGAWAQSGMGNRAAYFNGSSYLSINQPLLNEFTLSAWVYQDDVPKNRPGGEGGTIFSWGTQGDDYGVMCFDTRNGTLNWGIWDRATNAYDYTQASGMPYGRWTHVALTGNNSSYTLYLNGNKVAAKTLNLHPNIAMCTVGTNKSGNHIVKYFLGKMDEVALYNRAMTADEIQGLMKKATDIKSTALSFYLPFERVWTAEADESPNKRVVTNKGVTFTGEDNQLYESFVNISLPPLTFKSVEGNQPMELSANAAERNVELGRVDVMLEGASSGVNINALQLETSGTEGAMRQVNVYMSTVKDNYATEALVASLKPAALMNIKLDTLVYGNARFRITGDMEEQAAAGQSFSYRLVGVQTDSEWRDIMPAVSTTVTFTGNVAYTPLEKVTGLVKNPAMGWVLYLDAFGQMRPTADSYAYNRGVSDPEAFWNAFDACGATQVANIFYMRVPWSFVEPTKGAYGWKDPNSNFSKLVNGARERGLRLAFRIYVDGQDAYQQATPQYVKDDGAQGTVKMHWTPYASDPVFLASIKKFITEFGKEFNKPNEVDYIDAMGLGTWGEGHNIPLNNGWGVARALDSIASYYRAAFPDVLLGMQEGNSIAWYAKDITQPGKRLVTYDMRRRDSFGMTAYYRAGDRADYANFVLTKGVPLMAENGWNYFGHRSEPDVFRRYTESAGTSFPNMRSMMEYTLLTDVLPSRANTFDLRVPEDAEKWMLNRDLVDKFIDKGGYRFVPVKIVYKQQQANTSDMTVTYTFKNTGVGILPNGTPAYAGKFKLFFALINNETNKVHSFGVDTDFNKWTNVAPVSGTATLNLEGNVPVGTYSLCYAIVDTRTGLPNIQFAVENPEMVQGWYKAGTVVVSEATGITAARADKVEGSATGIYTLGGVKIADKAETDSIGKLVKGVYIIDGKKVVK